MDFLLKVTSVLSQLVMNRKEFGVNRFQTHQCIQQFDQDVFLSFLAKVPSPSCIQQPCYGLAGRVGERR